MPDDPAPVFVYGTLTDHRRADDLLDDWRFDGDATLEELHRVDGSYPTLAPGGETAGRLLVTPEIDALDAYEGVSSGLYVRETVPIAGGGEPSEARRSSSDEQRESDCGVARVYVGDPDRLDAPVDWPGEGPFASRVRAYLDESVVVVRRRNSRSGRRADR